MTPNIPLSQFDKPHRLKTGRNTTATALYVLGKGGTMTSKRWETVAAGHDETVSDANVIDENHAIEVVRAVSD